jgi:hypothetical protein
MEPTTFNKMFLGCFFSSLLHATIADLFEPVSRASKIYLVRIWESVFKAGTNHKWALFVCLKQQLTCRLFDSCEEEFEFSCESLSGKKRIIDSQALYDAGTHIIYT